MNIAARSTVEPADSSKGLRRKAAKLALGLVFIALLINSLFGDRGVLHVLTQQRRAEGLSRDVAELRRENARLAREIEALRSDPRTLERLAREELGFAGPGETVFLIRQPTPSDGN